MMDEMEAAEPARVRNGRLINDLCASVTRESMRRGHARLADLKLSPGAYNLLRALGSRDDMTMADLRRELRIENSTASNLVFRMEKSGLLQKEPSPHDKRASFLKATPHATALMRRADQLMAVEASDMTHRLTDGEQLSLITLLERVLKNLSPED